MSTERVPQSRHRLDELIVSTSRGDLLEVEPLDLGPGTPATDALDLERGPEPTSGRPA